MNSHQYHDKIDFNNLPNELILNILFYVSVMDVSRFSRVNQKLHANIYQSRWRYQSPGKDDAQECSFGEISEKMSVVIKLKSDDKILQNKLFYLDYIDMDVDCVYEQAQCKCSGIYGCCGFFCGASLPGLWTSFFSPTASCILGTLLCLGCFGQGFADEEKRIEEKFHETRKVRHAGKRQQIENRRKAITEAKIKLFPPVCELITPIDSVNSNLRKRKKAI
jgi:hypothetical protein